MISGIWSLGINASLFPIIPGHCGHLSHQRIATQPCYGMPPDVFFCCHNFGPAQQGLGLCGLWIFRYLNVEEIPYFINLINLISWVFSYSLIPGTQGLKVFKLLVAPTTAAETLSDVSIYGAQGRQIQRSRVHHSPPCSHIMKMYNDVHRCTVISSKAGP